MKRHYHALLFPLSLLAMDLNAQVLVDSIPYPGMLNLSFWGIHVAEDTIHLGSDASGAIHFSDHNGGLLGSITTPESFNHGLIKREATYLFASDYTTSGATLHEIDLSGAPLNEWVFPAGLTGPSSGIGDLEEAGGGAIWFTMYYPDSDVYPFAYAYKWIPGSETFLDTVPLQGDQPYGIAVKGDTLFYVTDDLDGDLERIYSYDLANEVDLGHVDLPDTPIDNDQRPFGLHYYDDHLYLVANRQGGSAFAHQTIFIYSLDATVSIEGPRNEQAIEVYPNPATDRITVRWPDQVERSAGFEIIDAAGRIVLRSNSIQPTQNIQLAGLDPGNYVISLECGGTQFRGNFVITR